MILLLLLLHGKLLLLLIIVLLLLLLLGRKHAVGVDNDGGLLDHAAHLARCARRGQRDASVRRGGGAEAARPLSAGSHLSVVLASREFVAEDGAERIGNVVTLKLVAAANFLAKVEREADLRDRETKAHINDEGNAERWHMHVVEAVLQHIILARALARAAEGAFNETVGVVKAVKKASAPRVRARDHMLMHDGVGGLVRGLVVGVGAGDDHRGRHSGRRGGSVVLNLLLWLVVLI